MSAGVSAPMMLSPIMITKSKGNSSWNATICVATSYCPREPVPVSPTTANRTEPSFRGQGESAGDGRLGRGGCAEGRGGGGQRASEKTTRRRRILAWFMGVT